MDEKKYKDDRSKGEIARAAGEFIQSNSNGQSLITVTNVEANKDFKKAIIFVTILPEHKEKAALDFLKRQRGEFKQYVKKSTRLPRIPHFDFELDMGEKSRQRIDELI